MTTPVVVLYGPTASGKSALAMALARQLGGELVNADSMQVYAGAPVATACPSPAEYAAIPHHLYEVLHPDDPCNAKRWRLMVEPVLAAIAAAGRWPIIVGGTGFYIDALIRGLSPLPEGDETLRRQLGAEYDLWGAEAFHAKLAAVDPDSAARLDPNDRQRLIRAREVYRLSGVPLSRHHGMPRAGPVPGYSFHILVLMPPRDWLYRRCERRFDAMMRGGAVEEAARLTQRTDLTDQAPLLKAVGLAELIAMVHGEIDPDEAAAAGRRATRHYAKRQWTWARHQILEAALPDCVAQRLALEAPLEDPAATAAQLAPVLAAHPLALG